MAAAISPERRSFEAGPSNRCAGCPFAGSCSPCRPQSVRGESGSGEVVVFKGGFKELLSLPKLPNVIDPNLIDFGSARSEEKCSKCNETASTCPHAETSRLAA